MVVREYSAYQYWLTAMNKTRQVFVAGIDLTSLIETKTDCRDSKKDLTDIFIGQG